MRKILHQQIWQRMPQSWRRAALFEITKHAAPKPTPGAQAAVPIIVVGALRTASGLGQSARLCHDALVKSGWPVFGIDLTKTLMQPLDFPDFHFADGRNLAGAGTVILHVNSPLVPLAMMSLGRLTVREKKIIGYWAWELPNVPYDWAIGIPFVSEIWVPSRFTAAAIVPISAGRRVLVVPHPVNMNNRRHHRSSAMKNNFTVLSIFNAASSFARKNPCAAIEAFREAFGRDRTARLIVKTSHLSAFPEAADLIERARNMDTNIEIVDRIMSPSELNDLYNMADVLISLHRSEGFGLTLAEAMMRGLPVIATDWSGNVDFLADATGCPVRYDLVAAEDRQGTYHHPNMHWAEADVHDAARALIRLRADPILRQKLGAAAAQHAARVWSCNAYVRDVRMHLSI